MNGGLRYWNERLKREENESVNGGQRLRKRVIMMAKEKRKSKCGGWEKTLGSQHLVSFPLKPTMPKRRKELVPEDVNVEVSLR